MTGIFTVMILLYMHNKGGGEGSWKGIKNQDKTNLLPIKKILPLCKEFIVSNLKFNP